MWIDRCTLFVVCAVTAVSVLFGLGLAESVVRVSNPEATLGANLARLSLEAGSRSWQRPDAMFHHVGDGIYSLQFPTASEAAARRIMLVGDSFVMGYGVGEEYRFGTLLQRDLGPTVKVDVLATSSYSPIIYRNIVERAISSASYSAVVIFIDQTDPADDLIYVKDLAPDDTSHSFDVNSMREREEIIRDTYRSMSAEFLGLKGLARHLALFNRAYPLSLASAFPKEDRHYEYVRMSVVDRPILIRRFELEPDSDVSHKMMSLLLRHVDEIVRMCRDRHVPLFLAANPWEYQVSKQPRTVQIVPGPYPRPNRLEELLEVHYRGVPDVQVIPLTQSFRASGEPSSLFLDRPSNEFHWNYAGHMFVKQLLEQVLIGNESVRRANR